MGCGICASRRLDLRHPSLTDGLTLCLSKRIRGLAEVQSESTPIVHYLPVDYQTARSLLVNQGTAADHNPDALLTRLKHGYPPIPGQVTSLLLALKVVFESLRESPTFERELACSLHLLASDSRQAFEQGQRSGVEWPPLLDEDLSRIAVAVKSIFIGVWQG